MEICDCYRVDERVNGQKIPYCFGTKELDSCSCEGDKRKCDFYENVRARGYSKKEIKIVINPCKYVLNDIGTIIDNNFLDEEVKNIDITIEDFVHLKVERI